MPRLFRREDREVVGAGALTFAFLAAVMAFFALITAGHADVRVKDANAALSAAAATPVTLKEFSITPAMIAVPSGGKIAVTNSGTVDHNFTIEGTSLKTPDIKPGATAMLDVKSLKSGVYNVSCAIPGHKQAGMTAMLHVGTSDATVAASGTVDIAQSAAMDKVMKAPTDAYVAQLTKGANTKGVGNQQLAPKVLADGTKEFDLTAELINWEVSPGKTRASVDVQRHGSRARGSR